MISAPLLYDARNEFGRFERAVIVACVMQRVNKAFDLALSLLLPLLFPTFTVYPEQVRIFLLHQENVRWSAPTFIIAMEKRNPTVRDDIAAIPKRKLSKDEYLFIIGEGTVRLPCVTSVSGTYSCDNCNTVIALEESGNGHYQCLDCPSFDLCETCFSRDVHDARHRLERASILDIHRYVTYDLVDRPQSEFSALRQMPAAQLRDDPDIISAALVPSGHCFPWTPRENVIPPYWVGNLGVDEKPTQQGAHHVRCLGLRLSDLDPPDAPPEHKPPGYTYVGQLQLDYLRQIYAMWSDEDVATSTDIVTDAHHVQQNLMGLMWVLGKLGPINPIRRRLEFDRIPFALSKTVQPLTRRRVLFEAGTVLPAYFTSNRPRSSSVDDALRRDTKRSHTRQSWMVSEGAEWQRDERRRRSSSEQRYKEANRWIHQEIPWNSDIINGDYSQWRLRWFIWSSRISDSFHEHDTCDPSSGILRLVCILPSGIQDVPIQCGVMKVDMSSKFIPPFHWIRLDYPAGTLGCSVISVNGRPFSVDRRLEERLRQIRMKESVSFVYARSLCTNDAWLPTKDRVDTAVNACALLPPWDSVEKIYPDLRFNEATETIAFRLASSRITISKPSVTSGSNPRAATHSVTVDLKVHEDKLRCRRGGIAAKVGGEMIGAVWYDLIQFACDATSQLAFEKVDVNMLQPPDQRDLITGIISPWPGYRHNFRTVKTRPTSKRGRSVGPADTSRSELQFTRSQSVQRDQSGPQLWDRVQLADLTENGAINLDKAPLAIWFPRRAVLDSRAPFEHAFIDYSEEFHLCCLAPRPMGGARADDGSIAKCGLLRHRWCDPLPEMIYVKNSLAGDNAILSSIMLNGRIFWIPSWLELFLRSIRDSTRVQMLFVWPLCMPEELHTRGIWRNVLIDPIKEAAARKIDAIAHIASLSQTKLELLIRQRQCQTLPNVDGKFFRAYDRYKNDDILYEPLDPTSADKRLVTVLPDNPDEHNPIHCRMEVFPQMGYRDVKYVALSYLWGAEEDVSTILVNDTEITVRRNLHDFLVWWRRWLRDPNRDKDIPLLLWIDALSINQNNLKERAREVKKMGLIYTNAKMTLVWSGKNATLTPLIPSHLPNSADIQDSAIYQHLEAVADFVAMPYWNRVWCTQELALSLVHGGWLAFTLAGYPRVYGTVSRILELFELQLHKMATEIYNSASKDGPSELQQNGILQTVDRLTSVRRTRDRLSFLVRLWERLEAKEQPTLLTLLIQTTSLECSVLADKIYSLWNIAADSEPILRNPDYTLTAAQTFIKFTQGWIEHYRRLDILSLSRLPGARTNVPNLPSWVRDWSDRSSVLDAGANIWPASVSNNEIAGNIEDLYPYNADRGMFSQFSFTTVQGHCGLKCTALFCDKLVSVPISIPSFDDQSFDQILSAFNQLLTHMRTLYDGEWWSHLQDLHDDKFADRAFTDLLDGLITGRNPRGNEKAEVVDVFETTLVNDLRGATVKTTAEHTANVWQHRMRTSVSHRCLAVSYSGFLGFVPENTKPNSSIAIIPGCRVPLVLEAVEEGLYRVIGDCYFRSLMDGLFSEAFTAEEASSEGPTLESIVLV
nr:hypothetical protein CFP56_52210 [Quercus suber]